MFAALEGDRPALIVDDLELSYRELGGAVAAHAKRLADAGVKPGDRVAIVTQRNAATPVTLVGNVLAGVVTVPINPSLGDKELGHVIADGAPKLVLAADPSAIADRVRDVPVARALVEPGGGTAPRLDVSDDPLLVLYTSGTTGAPKGAVLTVDNCASNVDGLAEAWAWCAEDTVVHALPLFHVHGLVLGLFGSLRAGGCLHWVPRFTPEAVAAALRTGRTMLFAVPTMHHRLADAGERDGAVRDGLRAARLLVSGSAALPLREHQRIADLAGKEVVERYGLTETLINCAVRHDAPTPGYVGPPVPGVELRLVADDRSPLNADDDTTIGEVAVRGRNVFAGYLNRPDATAAVLQDGWFHTGDLATRRPDGVVRIVGRRATDLIKTGGFKVGAGEVEGALLEDPGVAEVAVLGLPDDDLGERIVAFVVPRDPEAPPEPDALATRVADALSPHKRPREVRFVGELPRNAMGKVQKARLRDG